MDPKTKSENKKSMIIIIAAFIIVVGTASFWLWLKNRPTCWEEYIKEGVCPRRCLYTLGGGENINGLEVDYGPDCTEYR